jgi:hypothetical protein
MRVVVTSEQDFESLGPQNLGQYFSCPSNVNTDACHYTVRPLRNSLWDKHLSQKWRFSDKHSSTAISVIVLNVMLHVDSQLWRHKHFCCSDEHFVRDEQNTRFNVSSAIHEKATEILKTHLLLRGHIKSVFFLTILIKLWYNLTAILLIFWWRVIKLKYVLVFEIWFIFVVA